MNHSKRFFMTPCRNNELILNQLTLDGKNSSNNLSLGTLYFEY